MKVLKRIGIIVLILSIMILILFKKDSVSNNVITKYELKEENISVDEENIINNLNEIGSNIRNFGSDGSQITANFFKNKLNEYGYDVEFQEFDIYKQNIDSTLYVKHSSDYFDFNPYNSDSLGKGRNIIAKKNNNSNNKK
ncbi:MAG: Zn-dependent exopeptidase M28, partial [Clostridium perfringens]|nr:Zn-dependent exopeptidase M28 [Clostridium perfringens]